MPQSHAGTAKAMLAVRDARIDVPGGQVFVRRWDPGDHPGEHRVPIVLLHDSLGCVGLWRDFPAALACAATRPVIAYDRLGFGSSSPRREPAATGFIGEEAEVCFPAIRAALGLSRCSLFGHSVGGAMALAIAASQPGCEAVVTEAAQAFVEARTLDGIRAAARQFDDPVQFAKIARWHGDKARWVLEAWTEVWLSPGFSSWSLAPLLGQVACPVLAIHGDRDEYGSLAFPRRIVDGVGGPAQLAVLEGCGHVPHREREPEVLALASDFLRRAAV